MNSEFYTPREVAERLKVSTQMVLKNIHSGQWECQKISDRTYRFTQEQFDLITSRPVVERRATRTRQQDMEFRRALKKLASADPAGHPNP